MFRHALQTYIDKPENEGVIFHDEHVVIVQDAFPKATRHYLVIPRSKKITRLHPFDAFKDPIQYTEMEEYVEKAKDMMAESVAAEGLIENEDIPKAHFKNTFIRAGIHLEPSLANVHIHVITQDFHLSRLKNRKHYNSFVTAFFVDFDRLAPPPRRDFLGPASDSSSDDDDLEIPRPRFERRSAVLAKIIRDTPLSCVYCGESFGSSFVKLKKHLAGEYERKFSRPSN